MSDRTKPSPPLTRPQAVPIEEGSSESLAGLAKVELLEVQLGPNLGWLVDASQDAKLLKRMIWIQRRVASELGLIMPDIKFRSSLALAAQEYNILISNCVLARGTTYFDRYLAFAPLETLELLPGEVMIDPTYQQHSKWIEAHFRRDAELLDCLTYDPVSVVANQIESVVREHSALLLGVAQVNSRLEEEDCCLLARTLAAKGADCILIWQVLRLLLKEKVSIRDTVTILQAIAAHIHGTQEPVYLAEYARVALSESICTKLANQDRALTVFTLDAELDALLEAGVVPDSPLDLQIDGETWWKAHQAVADNMRLMLSRGQQPVLFTSPTLRPRLRRLLERAFPDLTILSWDEIPHGYYLIPAAQGALEWSISYGSLFWRDTPVEAERGAYDEMAG